MARTPKFIDHAAYVAIFTSIEDARKKMRKKKR